MFSISSDYAPPFKMISPFFWIGSIVYLISTISLFTLNPQNGHFDLSIVAWIHWFLLGFVMMIIFGAMAQLIPVVVEVGHFIVELYYSIWVLLIVGTTIMVYGFLYNPFVLSYGGLIVLIAMIMFLFDTIMTLSKVTNITLTVKTVLSSNLFLLSGIIIGFLMSLSMSGGDGIDITHWLGAHAVMVLAGYVTLTIMGLSMILVPMFGLSHGFDDSAVNLSFKLMVGAVILYFISTIIDINIGKFIALIMIFLSITLYIKQVYILYQIRARKENDIWAKSLFVGYGALIFSVILGFAYTLTHYENFLMAGSWFLIMGFFAFLINGHLYKIIPFLVWFEKYSPLVGKEKVPMLHEMLPKRMARCQFLFSSMGMLIAGIGILIGSDDLFKGGVTLLITGAVFMLLSVKWMLNYGK